MVAGGVDGFSRLVTFLECTNNNKAKTLLDCFLKGVDSFGVPLRVRSDLGLENSLIAEFMIKHRGCNRGSMLTGKSTHNQRIERLWRDVYVGVLSYFYNLFYYMEDWEVGHSKWASYTGITFCFFKQNKWEAKSLEECMGSS